MVHRDADQRVAVATTRELGVSIVAILRRGRAIASSRANIDAVSEGSVAHRLKRIFPGGPTFRTLAGRCSPCRATL
jgi:hypothetical protein